MKSKVALVVFYHHLNCCQMSIAILCYLFFIAAPPSFDKGGMAPDEITNAVTSGTAVITCQPAGSPRPKVTWLKGSTVIGESSDKFSVSDDGTLRIFKVGKNDRGTYTCIGRNTFGVIKKSTYLMIKGGLNY